MNNSILEQLNRDLDEIHRYYEALGFWLVDGNSDSENWKTPTDKNGPHTFRILKGNLPEYLIVGCSQSHSKEAGANFDINQRNAGKSFSNCVKSLENITAKELARRYANKYGNGQRKGKDNSPSSLRSQQPPAKPEPPEEPKEEKPRFAFPRELKLDEDALLLPDGRELKQDQLLPNVYTGSTGGGLIENTVFLYERPLSLVYRVKYENGVKDFRQYSFNAQTGRFTMGGVDNQNRRLFNEQAAYSAEVVFYCEGEKCAFQLQRYFLKRGIDNVAVVTAGGCGNINPDVIREALGGKSVYILPDNDDGGYKCALEVKTALLGTGATVQVFQWNDSTAAKYDIADFLADRAEPLTNVVDLDSFLRSLEDVGGWTDGGFLTDLEKKADEPAEDEDDKKPLLRLITMKELLGKKLPPKKMLLSPWLREGSLTMVTAATGVGKSWFSLTVAKAVSEGTDAFGRWKAEGAHKVLYLDGEMEDCDIIERAQILKIDIDNENLTLHTIETDLNTIETDPDGDIQLIDVGQLEWQNETIDKIKENGIELLILDNVFSLYDTNEDSNNAKSWKPMQNFLLRLRALKVAVLLVDHQGKNREVKSAMGTAAKSFFLNATFSLSHPDDYRMEDGARFVVEPGKGRSLKGRALASFTATLNDNGCWSCLDAEQIRESVREEQNRQEEYALELFRNGKTPEELSSPQYAGIVPKKGLNTLYEEYMPKFIAEQYNNCIVTVKDLLERYEKPMVRRVILSLYPNNYGAACAILFEAGDNQAMIMRTLEAIRPGAEEPKELREAIDAKQAENNRRLKETCLKAFDNGQRIDELIDELKRKFGKKVTVTLLKTYFSEWSAEQARKLLDNGANVADIIAAKLEDNRCQYDHAAVATAYINRNDNKIVAFNELIALDSIDKKTLEKIAELFGLSMPKKSVGRPRKEEAETDPSTTSTTSTAATA